MMLANVPLWVFGVLALLISLGLWQSRPREVAPLAPSLIAGAFVLFSAFGVLSSFGPGVVQVLAWSAGSAGSILAGARIFGPSGLARVQGSTRVALPGSWLPLALMMGIFLTKFLVGFVQGAHLAVGAQPWFPPAVSVALGAFSGGFVARALAIRRFAASAA